MSNPKVIPFLRLKLHSSDPRQPRHRVEAGIDRLTNGSWRLSYRLIGNALDSLVPAGWCESSPAKWERRDELWRRTCFEAFFQRRSTESFVSSSTATRPIEPYFELNLDPSGAWNFYLLTKYRSELVEAEASLRPDLLSERAESEMPHQQMQLIFSTEHLSSAEAVVVGLSAVVIEPDDDKPFFWALHHPDSRPDFHHPDSFSLRFEPSVALEMDRT